LYRCHTLLLLPVALPEVLALLLLLLLGWRQELGACGLRCCSRCCC
jgi:hypothetical protein